MNIKIVFLVIASISLVGSIALFFVFPYSYYKELTFILTNKQVNEFRGNILAGKNLLFTGIINENNSPIIGNFIIAQDQKFYGGEDSGWTWRKNYKQEFNLNCGNKEIRINPLNIKILGKFNEVYHPEDNSEKTVGFIIGSEITVFGEVVSESPLKVEASSIFGGEVEIYKKYLKKNALLSSIIPVVAVIFATVFFLGILKFVMNNAN